MADSPRSREIEVRPYLSLSPGGVKVRVFLAPRASASRIMGVHGDSLKVAVSAPPVEGAANEALIKLLSKLLKLPLRRIQIVSGEQSRHKVLLLQEASLEEIADRLPAP